MEPAVGSRNGLSQHGTPGESTGQREDARVTHPLDGARLKVARARGHLEALKVAIAIWLQEQPRTLRSQPAPFPNLDNQVLPRMVPNDPPRKLSALVGDCVTNARAALDYIAWELARKVL